MEKQIDEIISKLCWSEPFSYSNRLVIAGAFVEISVKVIDLLEDVIQAHRDPQSSDYNDCDTDQCQWCEDATGIVEILKLRLSPDLQPSKTHVEKTKS